MKKYKDLYEEEKQRHEEAQQRHQEDHMDEMEIINLRKRCNKRTTKVSQPKIALGSTKLDEPKKAELIDDLSEEEQEPKKASRTTAKAGKKVKKTLQHKKAPKSPELIDSIEEEEEEEDDTEPPLLGVRKKPKVFLIFGRIVKI